MTLGMTLATTTATNKNGLRAIYPGSFDPITNGHLDILDRACSLFSEVIVVVAGSGHKNPLFTPEERIELIREVVSERKQVKVDLWPGLIMDYCHEKQINAVVRGLRAASDFEYEFMMASMNKQIRPEVETVFMMTGQNLYFISSSMVKELFHYGGDIKSYVPAKVLEWLKTKQPKKSQKK